LYQGKEQLVKVMIWQCRKKFHIFKKNPKAELETKLLSLRKAAYENADVVIMLYDIKIKNSLDNMLDKVKKLIFF
jgi:GTPase SAR1 family protein